MVRAKFKCESTHENGYAMLRAVYGPENEPWSTATPHGELQITISNPAARKFEAGKEYYLDFSPVRESQVITKDDVGSVEDALGR